MIMIIHEIIIIKAQQNVTSVSVVQFIILDTHIPSVIRSLYQFKYVFDSKMIVFISYII